MTLHDQKKAFRQEAAQRMKELEPDYLRASDEAIFHRLLNLPALKAAPTIFCYVSAGKEPSTGRLIETLLAMGKQVAVPRCQGDGIMDACPISALSELLPAPFGLREPHAQAEVVLPDELGLVIAPCVAADRHGVRLGHGAGYYDHFLADTNCPVICLCHSRLLFDHLPCGDRDRKVDLVVTEDGLYPEATPQ